MPEELFRFGIYELDPGRSELRKQGLPLKLAPQPYQALELLVRRAGDLVSREEMQQQLWEPGTFVDFEQGLNYCIRQLRIALNDDAARPRFIETLPKRGYRFVAPVEAVNSVAVPVPDTREPVVTPEIGPTRRTGTWILAAVCAFIGLAFLLARWSRPLSAPFRITPLTTVSGLVLQPAFSPDGKQIAFAWSGENPTGADIYVQMVGANHPLRLTRTPLGYSAAPHWSPDGQNIIFSRCGAGQDGIFMIPALGGAERKLTDLHQCALQGTDAGLTADAGTLIFTDSCVPPAPPAVIALSLAAGTRRCLTSPSSSGNGDSAPALSPDGKSIAFVRTTAPRISDVYTVPLAGGETRRITNDQSWMDRVSWSSDGRRLLYSSSRGGSMQIWQVTSGGGNEGLLPGPGPNSFAPTASRDGRHIAYVQSAAGEQASIWRADLKGTRYESRKLLGSAQGDTAPNLSPDGRRVAFESERTGGSQVWIANNDGSNALQLTSFRHGTAGTPRWSPDGQQIAFDARPGEHSQIFVTSPEGGTPRALTSCGCETTVPSWSHDGHWIYYSSNRSGGWQIWRQAMPVGTAEQVTHNGGFNAMESLDAAWLYYNKPDQPGLWRMPIGGGVEEKILNQPAVGSWGWWDLSADALFYLDATVRPKPVIRRRDLKSRAETGVLSLEKLPSIWSAEMTVSPDGRTIYYTQEDPGSVVMLIDFGR